MIGNPDFLLGGPAFSCNCPSRKFPCKHSLGLLLLAAEAGLATIDLPAARMRSQT